MAHTTMSIEQIHYLFGYKKTNIKWDDVFSALLFAIALPDYDGNFAYGYCPVTTDDSQYVNFLMNIYPKLDTARTELPKYLGQKYHYNDMLQIDTKMRMLELKRAEFKEIPWYHLRKFIKSYRELRRLSEVQIPVQTVFGYVEYRGEQAQISPKTMRDRFTAYAQEFPKQLENVE